MAFSNVDVFIGKLFVPSHQDEGEDVHRQLAE